MEKLLRIEMLGGLRVVVDGRVITRFRSQRFALLLAYLAFDPHRAHSRETLVELLWPEGDPEVGRVNLRQALSSLRRQLESPMGLFAPVIIADRATVQVNPAAVETDVAAFEGAWHVAVGGESREGRIARLTGVIDRYRGEFLPGFCDEWVLLQRERLAEIHLQALQQLATELRRAGRIPEAIEFARRAVRTDPLREETHQALIRLLVANNQPEAARRQYQELARVLADELAVEPSRVTQALVATFDPIDAALAAPDSAPCLWSAETPQAAIDRAVAGSPHLSSAPAGTAPAGFVPRPLTRFFGREEELARLVEWLVGEPAVYRLVTLTGTGGSGKTRLALELAARLQQAFTGIIWFVPLVDLADPRFLLDRILSALRLSRAPGTEPLEQVAAFLSRQPCLLLLDNLEHLLPAGADRIEGLLGKIPTLQVLATSRQRLGLSGEREFPIAPLGTPPPALPLQGEGKSEFVERVQGCASVALFVDRAQGVRPDFRVTHANAGAVAGLCARLDGLPLAIELAAARIAVLSPAQMLARLEERFDLLVSRGRQRDTRHRSLRAALDWSFQLLSPELQRFFACLSVFRGGWSLGAAEAVCGEPQAVDHLEALRNCSLVVAEETADEVRFRLFETVREYGAEQLTPAQLAELARRHALYCLDLAESGEPNLRGPGLEAWMATLTAELDNLRAAHVWAVEQQETSIALRLANALGQFWSQHGLLPEGRERLEISLRLPGAEERTADRARALGWIGLICWSQRAYDTALSALREGIDIGRELGDSGGLARALNTLGWVEYELSHGPAARAVWEESLVLYRAVGDAWGIALSTHSLGRAALQMGDPAKAQRLHEEALALFRVQGDPWGLSLPLMGLGRIAQAQGEFETARDYLEECLAIRQRLKHYNSAAGALWNLGYILFQLGDWQGAIVRLEETLEMERRFGNRPGVAWLTCCLGRVAAYAGESERAAALLAESRDLFRELGDRANEAAALCESGRLAKAQGQRARALELCRQSLTVALDAGARWPVAEALEGMADVIAVASNQAGCARAARLLGAAGSIRRAIDEPIAACDRARYQQQLADLRASLDENAFGLAWKEGEAMSVEQAAREALGEERNAQSANLEAIS